MSTEGCIKLLISFIGVCAQVLTNGVGHQASCDSDRPAEKEGDENTSILAKQHGLQGIVEAEVHASVDEDANRGDGEPPIETWDAI